ncbi:blue copper protein isoform X2 [Amborella trichopoda]|uniref:Phytocyanin domain-containing protein n=1 Tax=Amborella trichopoda TaxID=13333 RepID=W1NV32_AMBTC|nr:blue copper protein isoform X2 [Amborella trichopoda]ERM99115.1 hypothetical protein AMTR_s00101p00141190 [Amborella trichopoda]|eukprot:XP_006836262.1 blue copper protein isoform X2 [Amborella trichopoda]
MDRICRVLLSLISLLFLLTPLSVQAYTNYTVGDSLGWYDKLEQRKINYPKWASGKNFSLGDFLIFNTDTNHTVIQTYNATTYKRCDAVSDDTIEWSSSDPSTKAEATTVSVPLLKEGLTYFFSGNYDGEQCQNGQKFKINVTHGQGLPESLRNPQESPGPAASSSDDDDSAPVTTVPSDFNNPVPVTAVNRENYGVSLKISTVLMGFGLFLAGFNWVLGV